MKKTIVILLILAINSIYAQQKWKLLVESEIALDINISTIPDYAECSLNNIGKFAFDLNQHTPSILNGVEDADQFTVTFYGNQADAETGQLGKQLNNPYVNQSSPEQIWARIAKTEGDYYTTAPFDIVVNPVLQLGIPDAVVEGCGVQNIDKNMLEAQFNLTENETSILGGLSHNTHNFEYYENKVNGVLTKKIANPTTYTNISSPQKVYVLVIPANGCKNESVELNLEVRAKPQPRLENEYILISDPKTNVLLPKSTVKIESKLSAATHSFQWSKDNQEIVGATGPNYTAFEPGKYSVVATNKGTGCVSEAVESNAVLSLEFIPKNKESNFVYTNPVYDNIEINNIESFVKAFIYDSSGRYIRTAPLVDSKINLFGLPKGNYIIRLDSKNDSIVFKVVKN